MQVQSHAKCNEAVGARSETAQMVLRDRQGAVRSRHVALVGQNAGSGGRRKWPSPAGGAVPAVGGAAGRAARGGPCRHWGGRRQWAAPAVGVAGGR